MKPLLSVTMISCHDRLRELFSVMAAEVQKQIGKRDVEFVCLVDNYRMPMGAKRSAVDRFASGDYVVTVDDDDNLSGRYVESLLEGCALGRDAVTYDFVYSVFGKRMATIRFYPFFVWDAPDPEWFRRPIGQFCPVRREIKVKYPHPPLWYGDDSRQSKAMHDAGAIRSVARIPEELYFYNDRMGHNRAASDLQARAAELDALPPPLLSVLMISYPQRMRKFIAQCERLGAQMGNDRRVELLCLYDNQKRSLGEKRNFLASIARGVFSVEVDDDDEIPDDYVRTLLAAIESRPDTDAVLFDQEVVEGEEPVRRIRPDPAAEGVVLAPLPDGRFARIPPHVQCFRTEHRRACPMPDRWFAEDVPQEVALCERVREYVRLDRVLYRHIINYQDEDHLKMQERCDART